MKRIVLWLVPFLLLSGCSTFQRDWDRLADARAPVGIDGRWEGSWKSEVSSHGGGLRCIVKGEGADRYLARFHAKYGKVFTFGYAVALGAEPHGESYAFSGEANLGWYAGGRYTYQGTATATNFFSTYRCKSDHGIFQMRRPPHP